MEDSCPTFFCLHPPTKASHASCSTLSSSTDTSLVFICRQRHLFSFFPLPIMLASCSNNARQLEEEILFDLYKKEALPSSSSGPHSSSLLLRANTSPLFKNLEAFSELLPLSFYL
ncbi:hypothetical protein AMTR_s00032p00186230 [Amborella trichopoda]|uniref:Uncharacterized protein n=1 Tax=Amborella trichopoda TaxID=13333 RepID=U5D0K0_AMBTC|nr:hypothetical protein AMTR_s00032p00186230 [Amborella trichopoda]